MKFFKKFGCHEDNVMNTRKLTAKGICFMMLATMGLAIVYSTTIQDIKTTQELSINSLKDEQFANLYNYITILYEDALDSANNTANDIEEDIKDNIDLNQLQLDMDNGIRNENLHEILRKNILHKNLNNISNYRNGIFVADSNGVIEDLSYTRSSTNGESRSWDNEIKNAYNSALEKDAISKILNQSKDIIIAEHVDLLSNKSHNLINCGTKDELEKIYLKEGIEGLKNYQFLAPAYITDQGDIFGRPDISDGKRCENSKLIVIQEFNIYDQISKIYPELLSDDIAKTLKVQYADILNWLYVLGCLYVVCVILSLIYISTIYNDFIERYDLIDEE